MTYNDSDIPPLPDNCQPSGNKVTEDELREARRLMQEPTVRQIVTFLECPHIGKQQHTRIVKQYRVALSMDVTLVLCWECAMSVYNIIRLDIK